MYRGGRNRGLAQKRLSRRALLRTLGGIGTIIVVGEASGQQTENDESWPEFGYDAANTGYAPSNNGPAEDIGEQWRFQTDGDILSSPAVVDNTVYIGSVDKNVYALDATDGTEQWRFQTDGAVWSSPTIAGGTVYVGSKDGTLYALSANDGTTQWQYETAADVDSAPTVVDDTVYIGLNDVSDTSLYAVSVADGQERWSVKSFGTATTVAIANNRVYVGTGSRELHAYNADTGDRQWTFAADDFVFSPPAVGDGRVYFGANDNNIYAVDAASGTKEWQYSTEDTNFASPAFANGTVYAVSKDNTVYALEASDGTEQWRFDTGDIIGSSPVIVDSTVYVGSNDENMYALDASDGTEKWRFQTDGSVLSSPAVVNNTVYLGAGNYVYALSGSPASSPTPPSSSQEPSSGFDPAVDGFGFRNWAINSDRYPEHDHEEISLDEVRRTVQETWPAQIEQTQFISNPGGKLALSALAVAIYTNVNQGSATNGHCYGMVYAAEEYYASPNEMPVAVKSASTIPRPTGDYSAVGDDIDYYHNTQILDFNTWSARQVVFGSKEIDYEAQLDAITSAIDETGTAGLSMRSTERGWAHQILATGYTQSDTTIEVMVYDPVTPAGSGEYTPDDSAPSVKFDKSGSTTTVEPYQDTYDRIVYTNADGRIDPSAMLLVGGQQAAAWFESLLTQAVTFLTQSPVELTVTDSEGTELSRMTAQSMSLAPTEYDHMRTDFGDLDNIYNVELTGTADGRYTLEVQGHQRDGTTISKSVEGEITEGETQTYRAVLPEESSNQAQLTQIDGDDSGESEQASGGDTNKLPPWLQIVGAGGILSGLGLGGYLYKQSQQDQTQR